MFPGIALIAATLSSELTGYLCREDGRLTSDQIRYLQALVALLSGGGTAVAVLDPIGGVLTVPLILRYLSQTNLPPEFKNILAALAPLASAFVYSPHVNLSDIY